jgi:membrane-associated phospholipid phosphatase
VPGPEKKSVPTVADNTVGPSPRVSLFALCFWLVLSITAIGLAMLLDDWVYRLCAVPRFGPAHEFAAYVSVLGQGWVILTVGGAVAGGLLLRKRFKAARVVFLIAVIPLLTGLGGTLCRMAAGRTRPCSDVPQGFYGLRHDSKWIVGDYEFSSFPSGHAATAIGLATAAWLVKRRYGLLACAYAVLVCWSRIGMKLHHFSDVVASVPIGVFGAVFLFQRLERWLPSRFGPEIWETRLLDSRHPQSRPLAGVPNRP